MQLPQSSAILSAVAISWVTANADVIPSQMKISHGNLEGTLNPSAGIRAFKGIPFAKPPVGGLRWQPPQPLEKWDGVRQAHDFGPRAMQRPIFSDMMFRSNGMSEDCLYLNVWSPLKSPETKLPVLVYFYGGGFVAGDGSEGRYDGESMAGKDIVSVTVNYRLGVFGFLAHPELTKESPHHASGNYALLDQVAALQWVHENIAAFGGDPKRVTIAGESAGSFSVSALMASPLSKDLIAGAIGESGSILGSPTTPLNAAEEDGVKSMASLGLGDTPTLGDMRALPAEKVVEAEVRARPTIDGWFFPKSPHEIYAAGEQAHVPMLAGVNSEESGYQGVLGKDSPTFENYHNALQRLYSDKADAVMKLYPATNETEVMDSARELASDRMISFGTWKWIDAATKNGGQATYYYLFTHPRPQQPPSRGASHSAEIEYAMGNLGYNKVYAWTPDDHKVSRQMQDYFANFIKTGDPNGKDLADWPKFASGQRLVIDVNPHLESTEILRARYEFLDASR